METVDHEMRKTESSRVDAENKTNKIRENLEKVRLDGQEINIRSKTIIEQLEEDGFNLDDVINLFPPI